MASHLELRALAKVYAGFTLGPLNLSFAPGRVHGLLGANGAGKTTMLSMITLQTRATSGTMLCGSEPILWGDAAWKERVAYVRETPALYDELTVAESIRFASRLYGRWDAPVASRMIARLGLRNDQRVKTLSKGTRVKLGIAIALAQRAELLILDEPTAGVDPTAREELYEILGDLRRQYPELCIVFSSHIFEDLETLADEVVILHGGEVAFQSSREQLQSMALYCLPPGLSVPDGEDVALKWAARGQSWVMIRRGSGTAARLVAMSGCVEETSVSLLSAAYRAVGRIAQQEAQ